MSRIHKAFFVSINITRNIGFPIEEKETIIGYNSWQQERERHLLSNVRFQVKKRSYMVHTLVATDSNSYKTKPIINIGICITYV